MGRIRRYIHTVAKDHALRDCKKRIHVNMGRVTVAHYQGQLSTGCYYRLNRALYDELKRLEYRFSVIDI